MNIENSIIIPKSGETIVEETKNLRSKLLGWLKNNKEFFEEEEGYKNDLIKRIKAKYSSGEYNDYKLYQLLVGGGTELAIDNPTKFDFPEKDLSVLEFYKNRIAARTGNNTKSLNENLEIAA